MLSGDFGTSLANGNPVTDVVGVKLRNSVVLLILSAAVAVPLAIGLGMTAAARPDGPFDRALNVGSLLLSALPEFVVGIVVVVVLATGVFRLLPAVSVVYGGGTVTSHPKLLVLPALTLILLVLPYLMRLVRASAVEVFDSDYVRAARLRGVGGARLLFRHVFPNVAAPVVQAVVLVLVYLVGGVVIVEAVFNFPGIGLGLLEAVRVRDLPVIQFLALAIALFYLVLNVVADLLTVVLTPKLRTGSR